MKENKTILIVATLDTKGPEAFFVKKRIEEKGIKTLVMDVGIKGNAPSGADVPSPKVAEAASKTLPELLSYNDEARAMTEMAEGAEKVVLELLERGAFDGVIALGGTMGTSLALRVFRTLPTGMTKVLVSTVAVSHFVTPQSVSNDVVMFQVSSDLWGLNRLEKRDLTKAALAIACAVESEQDVEEEGAPLVAMTTLGGSYLQYASRVKEALEKEGYEVAIFHSVSMQGAIMERFIMEGKVCGLLDLCPQEVLAELAGGYCCSPGRMEAAAKKGIPQIIGPGGLGFFPWGSMENLPERFRGRLTFAHNEIAGGIQSSNEEMAEVAKVFASKLNGSVGPVVVLVPERGFLEYDRPGARLYNPEGRKIFMDTLQDNLSPAVEYLRLDCHINDPVYAEKVVEVALRLFRGGI